MEGEQGGGGQRGEPEVEPDPDDVPVRRHVLAGQHDREIESPRGQEQRHARRGRGCRGAAAISVAAPPSRRVRASSAGQRLRDLTLRPRRREAGAGQAQPALVEHVARLPAWVELRVEAVQALDLEPRVGPAEQSGRHALEQVLGLGQQAGERGEVERDLLDAAARETPRSTARRGTRSGRSVSPGRGA